MVSKSECVWDCDNNTRKVINTMSLIQNFTIIKVPTSNENQEKNRVITMLNIYICSLFVLVGLVCNVVSFIAFVRAGRKAPRIMTKNLLILLTISNSIYLILFWYYSIFPKLINSLNIKAYTITNTTKSIEVYENSTIAVTQRSSFINKIFVNRYYFVNTNKVACKLISYSISVSIFLNSAITVSFSLERALAINFPLKIRDLRENYRYLFKLIIIVVIFISFTFPVYNLFLTNLVEVNANGKMRCDIPSRYESLYFNFTIVFVIKTLAIPFVIITLSNISILIAIERNKKNLLTNKFNRHRGEQSNGGGTISKKDLSSTLNSNGSLDIKYMREFSNLSIEDFQSRSYPSNGFRTDFDSPSSYEITNGKKANGHIHSNSTNGTNIRSLSNGSHRNSKLMQVKASVSCKITGTSSKKNMRVTKMFITISASFVLLNLPYFVAWCRYALYRLNRTKPYNRQDIKQMVDLYDGVKITEILILFYYAFSNFLYFATGKIYRENFYSIISFKKKQRKNLLSFS